MRLLPLLFLLALCTSARAQVREVVTKTIEDHYPYKTGNELAVEGEKAEIFVETWDKPEIHVRVVMTARAAELETAQGDLDNLHLISEEAGQKLFLKNKLRDPSRKSKSELTIHYYITLPEACPVYLKSHFGGATISNLRNRLRINGEFSAINIDNVQGLLDIRTRFGDIIGDKIEGNVTINARRSDIDLTDIGGTFTINAHYGELRLSPNRGLRALQVSADKSDVFLYEPAGGEGLDYTLSATNGELTLPDQRNFTELERTAELRKVRLRSVSETPGMVMVAVTFGDVYVGKR